MSVYLYAFKVHPKRYGDTTQPRSVLAIHHKALAIQKCSSSCIFFQPHRVSPFYPLHLDRSLFAHFGLLRVAVELHFRYQVDAGDGKNRGGVRQKTRTQRSRKIREVIVIQSLLQDARERKNKSLKLKRNSAILSYNANSNPNPNPRRS